MPETFTAQKMQDLDSFGDQYVGVRCFERRRAQGFYGQPAGANKKYLSLTDCNNNHKTRPVSKQFHKSGPTAGCAVSVYLISVSKGTTGALKSMFRKCKHSRCSNNIRGRRLLSGTRLLAVIVALCFTVCNLPLAAKEGRGGSPADMGARKLA